MKLPLTELRNSGPCSRPVLSYWGSCTARSGRGQGSSQGSFVGSSQGSFVGSRFHTTPHTGLKLLVGPPIVGSSLQADLVRREGHRSR